MTTREYAGRTTPKNIYLYQITKKKYFANLPSQIKIVESKILNPKKSLDHPPLKIRNPPQPPASARPLGGKERVRLDGEVGVMVPTDIEQKHMASSWFMTGAR